MSVRFKHFLSLKDFSTHEILNLLRRSKAIKEEVLKHSINPFLKNKTLAMIFTKKSTRTRVSAESGWALYGGHPLFLGMNDIQMAAGEPISTTATVISSLADCIIARMGNHKDIEELAKNSSVPVINALTNKYHPLQILADLCTIQETYPNGGIKVAWVGDSNNVLNSMLLTYPRLGYHLSVATPKDYPVDLSMISKDGPKVFITHDPAAACKDADIIMTDTWVSMGEGGGDLKKSKFQGFQVNEALGKVAKADWKFMHCLPRYSHEVDDEGFYLNLRVVFNSPRSLVFKQAEFRKYTVMAVYELVMKHSRNHNSFAG